MDKISITAAKDSPSNAAFCTKAVLAAGIDKSALLQALTEALVPFAPMLRDGCGVGVVRHGDRASIIGLSE